MYTKMIRISVPFHCLSKVDFEISAPNVIRRNAVLLGIKYMQIS